MLNPLHIYSKHGSNHILMSTIYSKNYANILKLKAIKIKVKTNNIFHDFLYLYYMTNIKSLRDIFFLSRSQKKYQTLFPKGSILTQHLNFNSFFDLYFYLFTHIFRDYIRQIQMQTVSVQKQSIIILIKNIPFVSDNKSSIFRSIFSNIILSLNIEIYLTFNTQALAKRMWFLNYLKLIKSEKQIWL